MGRKKKPKSDEELLALAKIELEKYLMKGEAPPRTLAMTIATLTKSVNQGKPRKKKNESDKPETLTHEQIQAIGVRLFNAFNARHKNNPAKTFSEAMTRDLEEQRERREQRKMVSHHDEQFKQRSKRFWAQLFGKEINNYENQG